jgi:GT2 family glycosyltransferase
LVNYHSIEDVAARLASEALQDAEVIVVDNASDPEEVRHLCHSHGATSVLLPSNRGFAAGVNAAWERVRDRPALPLLLLNPDAELTREALDQLLAALPSFDGVGPLLLEGPERPQIGIGGGPATLASVVGYFLFLTRLMPRWRGFFLTRAQARRGGPVTWVCMAALLLRADALERFGLLPEDEVVYAEDVAWGIDATKQGARFAIVPSAVVTHLHGSSGSSSAWVGAVERLLTRRLGRVRAVLAVTAMRTGLAARRALGRPVDGESRARMRRVRARPR